MLDTDFALKQVVPVSYYDECYRAHSVYGQLIFPQYHSHGIYTVFVCLVKKHHNIELLHEYWWLLINLDLVAFIWSNLSIQYKIFHWVNTAKTNPIRIFSVFGPIPVRPITARSESARRFASSISYCTRLRVQYDILWGTIFTNIHAISLLLYSNK
jgi:hypothetical protein